MTLYSELDGHHVIDARMVVPRLGCWFADVTLSDEVAVSGLITLTIANISWKCTPWRTASYQGRTMARVIGGHGGWQHLLPSKAYANPAGVMLSTILNDASRETGEVVGLTAPDVAQGNFYVREAAPGQRVLNRLADEWHVAPDGSTIVGLWPVTDKVATAFDVIDYDPIFRKAELATEDLAAFTPTRTFTHVQLGSLELQVSGVIHTMHAAAVRTTVLVE